MSVTISQQQDPLPPAVTKLLIDRLYEKRKTAALDIEKLIRDYLSANNHAEIAKIVKHLSNNYVLSQNQNNKKGGLIGLAACAIALGKEAHRYRPDLVPSVLACFSDPDSRVRYYACESLYNIVKVLRYNVLIYFNEIFDGLCRLCCDLDLNVRNGAELLDRLLKDTVTENSSNEKFDINVFMQLLRERIYVKNSYVRQFLVSWLKVLDSEPNLNLISHVAELLDGLFQILDDTNPEIKRMCEVLLGDMLKEIIEPPMEQAKYEAMINIIVMHCANKDDDSIQLTAMLWLKELIGLLGDRALYFMPGVLNVVLPCLAYSDETIRKNIKELARSVNQTLWSLIEKSEISADEAAPGKAKTLAIDKVIESLLRFTSTPSDASSVVSTIESLKWILHLVNKQPNVMLAHVDDFFSTLIAFLCDPAKEAVELDLQILATVSISDYFIRTGQQDEHMRLKFAKYNNYFAKFMRQFLNLFRTEPNMRYEKGSLIIKQLCVLLNPEDVYRMFSEILEAEKDAEFALAMVDTLNSILLTAPELFDLRDSLKDFETAESHRLFVCLYKTWCHNPIAAVALCLLSQNYEHAYQLVSQFSDIEITLNLLITIDKLVQLIESPIFTYLRLHLLEVERNQYLVRALYGLLMVLPQSEAFLSLKLRLDCVPNYFSKIPSSLTPPTPAVTSTTPAAKPDIDFAELLQHFVRIQEKHRFFKNRKRLTSPPAP